MPLQFFVVKVLSVPVILVKDFQKQHVKTFYPCCETVAWNHGGLTKAENLWGGKKKELNPVKGNPDRLCGKPPVRGDTTPRHEPGTGRDQSRNTPLGEERGTAPLGGCPGSPRATHETTPPEGREAGNTRSGPPGGV